MGDAGEGVTMEGEGEESRDPGEEHAGFGVGEDESVKGQPKTFEIIKPFMLFFSSVTKSSLNIFLGVHCLQKSIHEGLKHLTLKENQKVQNEMTCAALSDKSSVLWW